MKYSEHLPYQMPEDHQLTEMKQGSNYRLQYRGRNVSGLAIVTDQEQITADVASIQNTSFVHITDYLMAQFDLLLAAAGKDVSAKGLGTRGVSPPTATDCPLILPLTLKMKNVILDLEFGCELLLGLLCNFCCKYDGFDGSEEGSRGSDPTAPVQSP